MITPDRKIVAIIDYFEFKSMINVPAEQVNPI